MADSGGGWEKHVKPRRHEASPRNRKKMLHFAENLLEELKHLDGELYRLRDEHVRYALGRAFRLVNRLHSEVENDQEP